MNSRQIEGMMNRGKMEREIVVEIQRAYMASLREIKEKVRILDGREQTESVINRRKYQKALETQVTDVLANMNDNMYGSVDQYLKDCYEDGFIGTMYDLQGQGIPLVFPINQQDIVNSIVNNTKLSKPLYESMGHNVNELITKVNNEIARGVSMSSSYIDIARNIQKQSNIGMNRSLVIARTEGHRVRIEATADAQKKAKDRGADVMKQWDSTLDKKTRKTHAELDGQIQEIEDDFVIKSSGAKASHPAGFGIAKEDINCRCALLQRARWALDDEEYTKMNGDTNNLIRLKEKDFESFTKAYKEKAKEVTGIKIDKMESWYGNKHSKAIKERLESAPELYQNAWNECQDEFQTLDPKYRGAKAYYQPSKYAHQRGVQLNILNDSKGSSYQTPYNVAFHEYGHHMDYLLNDKYGDGDYLKGFSEVYKDDLLAKTLKEEGLKAVEPYVDKYVKEHTDYIQKEIDDMFDAKVRRGFATESERAIKTGKDEFDYVVNKWKSDPSLKAEIVKSFIDDVKSNLTLIERGDISDMFEPILNTAYPFGVGHGTSYWRGRSPSKEAFAEMYSAVVANPDSLKGIKLYFPNAFKVFEEMLGVIK